MAGDTINSTDDREINKMIVRHFVRLHQLREFNRTIKVVATEINYGGANVGKNVQRLLTPDPEDEFDSDVLESYIRSACATIGPNAHESIGTVYLAAKDNDGTKEPGVWTGKRPIGSFFRFSVFLYR